MSFSTDFSDPKVNILILNFLELKFKWHTLTSDLDNNFIQAIDIKD